MRWELVKLYGRLLRFLGPHLSILVAAVLFMVMFAALSGFSLAMIIPFTEIVLSGDTPAEISGRHGLDEAAVLEGDFGTLQGSDVFLALPYDGKRVRPADPPQLVLAEQSQ